MNGEDYEAGRLVPTKTPDYGPDPWRRGHDPLCPALEGEGLFVAYAGPVGGSDHIDCLTCAVIARVREDERGKAYGWPEYQSQRDKDMRATALRDAVEAVKALRSGAWGQDIDGVQIDMADAVAAIEALGKEQSDGA